MVACDHIGDFIDFPSVLTLHIAFYSLYCTVAVCQLLLLNEYGMVWYGMVGILRK